MSTTNDDTSVSVATTRNGGRSTTISKALDRLDIQHESMTEQQTVLLQALEKLQQQEACLSKALTLAQDQSKPPQRPKKKDDAAIRRLQEALLASDDSDEESSVLPG